MGRAMFWLPHLKLSDTGDGLVAVGATFLSYAATGLAPEKWRGICSVRCLSLELGGAEIV